MSLYISIFQLTYEDNRMFSGMMQIRIFVVNSGINEESFINWNFYTTGLSKKLFFLFFLNRPHMKMQPMPSYSTFVNEFMHQKILV